MGLIITILPPPPLLDSLSNLPRFGDLQWFLWALEQIKKVKRRLELLLFSSSTFSFCCTTRYIFLIWKNKFD